MSVARPRSRCPRCATPISWFDNLPVLSWLLLRARCRHCQGRIHWRYPAVEGGVAALFVLLALEAIPATALIQPALAPQGWVDFLVMALVSSSLVALTLIDIDYQILPDSITKSGIVLGPLLAWVAPRIQPTTGWLVNLTVAEHPVVSALGPRGLAAAHGVAGALFAGGVLFGIGWLGTKALKKEAMGFGDVKMLAAAGAFLGVWAMLALAVAALTGAIIGIVMKCSGKGRYIPFGPFLALGTWVVMLRGGQVLDAWLRLYKK